MAGDEPVAGIRRDLGEVRVTISQAPSTHLET